MESNMLFNEDKTDESETLNSCVVWTTIPILSWICPFLGHAGICDSKGFLYDFQGDNFVGKNQFLFSDPKRIMNIECVDKEILDQAISETVCEFSHKNYSLICSNCHLFVCEVLDRANVKAPCRLWREWNKCATLKLAGTLVFKGRTISISSFAGIWVPFLLFYGIIILIIVLLKTKM